MASVNKKRFFQEPEKFFVTCPQGLEQLLAQELAELNITTEKETAGGIYCQGQLKDIYQACLWSRTANRVLLHLAKADVETADDLYKAVQTIDWPSLFNANATLMIQFVGSNKQIRNTHFAALTVKDAVIDQFRGQEGVRPSIDKNSPDVRINVRLAKGKASIALDMSGDSLHKRAYRVAQGDAPLKENLAAALLMRCGWLDMLAQAREHTQVNESTERLGLLDPMCGSATLLIEAAMMAADIAPGIQRKRFGFEKLSFHQPELWQECHAAAQERKTKGLAGPLPEIRGYDINPKVLDAAAVNIEAAELADCIRLTKKNAAEFKKPTHIQLETGLLICNPPYGERLGEINALREDYRRLGQVVKAELEGWQVGIFTGNTELGKEMRLRPKRRYKFFNGKIPSELILFDIRGDDAVLRVDERDSLRQSEEARQQRGEPGVDSSSATADGDVLPTAIAHQDRRSQPLSDGAQMVANRLKKNRKRLNSWLKKESVMCYRAYDADMPEYSAAIDVYGDHLHIQEYQAPRNIEEHKAEARFEELVSAAAHVFDLPDARIATKQRRRNRGKMQYEKVGGDGENRSFDVVEGRAKIRVNLWDYLDTGLFLDHRPLRLRIAEEVAGKRFLNLFCYTASATVQAALGGAGSSVSVDMSRTYLDWASRNFQLNNINPARHQLVNADCFEWLKNCREGFDMIMLDPPSFSNSKKMQDVLDVQRDHVALVKRCMELLTPSGVLYFSNNLRSFKLDSSSLQAYDIKNISAETLGPDFKQNPKIHYCWEIRHQR